MSYIYQHTQDRINGLATFNYVTEDGVVHKFKISSQLIGELIVKAVEDGVATMRKAKGREKYDRVISRKPVGTSIADRGTLLTDIEFGRNINKRIQTYFTKLQLQSVGEVIDYPIQDLLKIKGFGRIAYTYVYCTLEEQFPHLMEDK
tara:strand:+ start:377 stop:817 length:441 start_codon:yes stop_codon:yes gene_type:complete